MKRGKEEGEKRGKGGGGGGEKKREEGEVIEVRGREKKERGKE